MPMRAECACATRTEAGCCACFRVLGVQCSPACAQATCCLWMRAMSLLQCCQMLRAVVCVFGVWESHRECRCWILHSHGRRNLTKKKLKKLEKEELCEQLMERMQRARDVYSTFRVELREVLREKGKVSRLFAAPAHVSSVCPPFGLRAGRV